MYRRVVLIQFQSTLPVRGATFDRLALEFYDDISIHAPREGSDFDVPGMVQDAVIS